MPFHTKMAKIGVEKISGQPAKKAHTAAINNYPAIRPNRSHRRVFAFNICPFPRSIIECARKYLR